ncbi:MAG TPA: TonB-dependent receptor [Vicinamibacterales bacterium]|nr:TonB-dependent receptor [Vicinamibacterales bacterium]
MAIPVGLPGFVLSMAVAAAGQVGGATASVQGVVRDALGAVIPGSLVTIVCGNERRQVTTSASGEFAERGLPGTRCALSAAADAFETRTVSVDTSVGRPVTIVLTIRRYSEEVVVTSSRVGAERAFDAPEATSVTSRQDLDTRPYTLLTEALREEPGILLQQTSSAQTSPIIRGFTGQSNVYLLDGVRFNVASWRGGPSQYTAWLDAGPIDSIEVVRGAGSVQYGSDALGGTIQFLTDSSAATRRGRIGGNLEFSAASANKSTFGGADVAFGVPSASIRVGGSGSNVEDLRAGGGLDSHNAVTRFLGLPSTILGERQVATGYEQRGAYAVVDTGAGRGATLHALYMRQNQYDATRYDRILGGEGLYSSGFDPQQLDFASIRYGRTSVGWFDSASGTFSLNRQGDGRYEQSRPNARLDAQTSATTSFGYQGQVHHAFRGQHNLVIGAEAYDESITAERRLIDPGNVVTAARPDIPEGTTYTSAGAFAQQTADVSSRVSVRGGVRVSSYRFSTTADPLFGVVDEHVTMNAATFQTSAVVRVTDGINVTGNVTRGFRAANMADFANVGLTGGGGFEISPTQARELHGLVGTTGATGAVSTGDAAGALKPEVVYQYDLGVKGRVGRISGSLTGFDLELYDFIQRRALVFDPSIVGTTISGFTVVRQDATGLAYIAQDARPLATRVNTDRGRIRGFDAEGEARVTPAWTASAYFSMANGRTLPSGDYSRRMNPPMGGARLRWVHDKVWAEGVLTFAAEQTRFNSGDVTDARIGANRTRAQIATFFNGTATDLGLVQNGILLATGETLAQVQTRVLGTTNGAPLFTSQAGFAVVGLRGGLQLAPGFDLTLIAENIGDVNYRLYGSGLDAPGFNLQFRTRYRF